MNIPWFNGRCDELNTYLIRYFKDDKMKDVVFWKHSGFWSTESQHTAYCKDGVHLNTQSGLSEVLPECSCSDCDCEKIKAFK